MKDERARWQREKAAGITSRLRTCYFEPKTTTTVLNKTKDSNGDFGFTKKKITFGQTVTANLLLLNRGVHREATAVLYGSNCFSFQTAPTAVEFMDWTGDQSKLMGNIRVFSHNPNRDAGLLHKTLRPLQHPGRFEINLSRSCTLEKLWPHIKAYIDGSAPVSCGCVARKGTCTCMKPKRMARLKAITIGPEHVSVTRGDDLITSQWYCSTLEERMYLREEEAESKAESDIMVTCERRRKEVMDRLLEKLEAREAARSSVQHQT